MPKQSTPATAPIRMATSGLTKPAAGVIATMPAIAPLTIPRELGLPWYQLAHIHARAPAAAALFVFTNAVTALAFTAKALPALNPNHPNQSRAAPRSAIGILWGSSEYSPKPARFPITSARASAANPDAISTTVPPAKSIRPICCAQPPPHAQCASGQYTTVSHTSTKTINEVSLILSATAEVTIVIVTEAKKSWKTM